MHEWALLIFTVCIPVAVGGFLFLGIFHKKISESEHGNYKMMKLPLLVLTSLSILGLLASFFHLGKPSHAFYAIVGFGRSWMSNEILFTGAFIALACVTLGLAILKKKTNAVLLFLTAAVGLIDIYCMATAYAVTRVNGWSLLNTYLVFYGTVFTLGPILTVSLIGKQLNSENFKDMIKWAFVFSLLGIGIQALGTAVFSASSPAIELVQGTTAVEKLGAYNSMITTRWVIEVMGLAVFGFLAMSSIKKINFSYITAVLAALVVAEGISRYLFYVLGA